jgi:hypothetical protein
MGIRKQTPALGQVSMLDDPKIEEINFLTQGLVPGPQMSKTGRTIFDQVSFVGAPTFACEHAAINDVRICLRSKQP